MYCGKIQIENNKFVVQGTDAPKLIRNIISNLSTNGSYFAGSLCNIQYIEARDFEKDSDKYVTANAYLAKLLQTENYVFGVENEVIAEELGSKILPTLHLSVINFFQQDIFSSTGIAIPRCLKYIDSSIWHYYVPLFLGDKTSKEETFEQDFKDRLQMVLDTIMKNTNDGLYHLSVTQEQADFYARIVQQSYLADIGAHKKRISPFLFHSEREIKESLLKMGDKLSSYMPAVIGIDSLETSPANHSKARWRFLLVDDFSKKGMKTYPPGQTTLSKEKRIRSVLDTLFVSSDCIELESVPSVMEAVDKLKTHKYDLILLDYLLDYKPGGQREYGYELLDRIEHDEELKANRGPLGRFWIFPITSFDEAFTQKMREQGWNYNTENWLLAQGACPLDTPESFKYYLLSFMNRQLEGLGIKVEVEVEAEKHDRKKVYVHTLAEFLMKIFEDTEVARKRAIKNISALYLLRANYKKLKDDVRTDFKSLLVESIYTDIGKYNSEFWEHIVFMMYLTAYPPANQWFRLTHEFLFIKEILPDNVSGVIAEYIKYMKGR